MKLKEQIKIAEVGESMWYFRALHRNLLLALKKYAPPKPAWILDGGSGAGGLANSLASEFPNSVRLAVDIDFAALQRNQTSDNQLLTAASINALPIADKTISAYVSADIIYHRAVDPVEFAQESYRCLSPGGVIVINVPAYQWLFSAHDRQVDGVRRYTLATLKQLLEPIGFKIVYGTYWNTLLFPLLVFWRKVLARDTDKSDLRYFPKPLEALFNLVMLLEHRVLSLGIPLPFGGSVLIVAKRN